MNTLLNQKQAPNLKQLQRLIMSPQMQQALSLLQLPAQELSTLIDAELEQNPILEMHEDREDDDIQEVETEVDEAEEDNISSIEKSLSFNDRDFEIMKQLDDDFKDHFNESASYKNLRTIDDEKLASFLESSIRSESTLFGHLMQQAQETFDTDQKLKIAEAIIGSLDERGILQSSLEEIALLNGFEYNSVAEILKEVQGFDPPGVGARSLQELLLIQLANLGKKSSLAYQIVLNHYEDLIHNRIPRIQKLLKCTPKDISDAIEKDIAKLDFHPGTSFSRQVVQQIVPDIIISQEDDSLVATIPDEYIPTLRLNRRYLKMLEDESLSVEAKDFIKQKLLSAKWLMKNIFQRNETLQKIAQFLIDNQSAFFLNPDGKLVPMTMKKVADELDVHESTIARAVSNKYLSSPRGVYSLRSFFTTAYISDQGEDISAQTVRDLMLEVIENEDKKKPLSDEAIATAIKERGVNCARRTVAKYRAALSIGNAHQRKKY